MRYDQSKSDRITGSLWEGETKRQKKSISLKIYLLLHFSSNLAQIFRKCYLDYKKNVFIISTNRNLMTKKKSFLMIYRNKHWVLVFKFQTVAATAVTWKYFCLGELKIIRKKNGNDVTKTFSCKILSSKFLPGNKNICKQ